MDTFDITPTDGGGKPRTMSSLEIAELCEARHNDVVATILRLFGKGVLRESRNTPRAHQNPSGGRPTQVYDLTKRDALVVVSGYDDEIRARVIDRWEELERERRSPSITAEGLLSNPRQLLAITQGYALQIEDMKRDIAILQQDVAVVDRFGRADDWFGVRRSAKMLDMPERKFTDWLQRMGWAFRQNGTKVLLGYSDKQKKGFLKNVPHTYTKQDGSEGVRDQLVFSMAGLIRIAKMLNVTLNIEEAA